MIISLARFFPRARSGYAAPVTVTDTHMLDELCVDTIRTLSMDAVQKANSGPPGHADGAGADRVRPVHAGDAPQPRATRSGPTATASSSRAGTRRCCCTRPCTCPATASASRDLEQFRQLGSPAAGHPEYGDAPGHRGDDRPARAGHLPRASGWRWPSGCSPRASTGPGHEIVDHRTFVIASDGDLEEGISGRGVLARRPPRPRPPDRVLRRQPHLDRGRHRARVHRGRRQALRGLRLARPGPRRGHRRSTASSAALEAAMAVEDRPSLIIFRTHIALRQPEQAGHRGRPRLAAGRGGGPAHQGALWLAVARAALLRPRGGAGALPPVRRARRGARARLATSASTPTARRIPSSPPSSSG